MGIVIDNSIFFNTNGMGIACIQNPSGAANSFNAVFDDFSVEIDGVLSSTPMLEFATGAITPVKNDTIRVSGTDYRVEEIQPDGTGLTRLILSKA